MWMSTHGQGTQRRRNIAENYNRLSRVQQRYRQTDDRRQTDGRHHVANVNVSSGLLKSIGKFGIDCNASQKASCESTHSPF